MYVLDINLFKSVIGFFPTLLSLALTKAQCNIHAPGSLPASALWMFITVTDGLNGQKAGGGTQSWGWVEAKVEG